MGRVWAAIAGVFSMLIEAIRNRRRRTARLQRGRRVVSTSSAGQSTTNPSFIDQPVKAPFFPFIPRVEASGYREPFAAITEATAPFIETVACVVDTTDTEVDLVYVDKAGALRWGEATLGLAQQTAITVLTAGAFTSVAAAWDGSATQLIMAGLLGDIYYERVSKDGAVVSGPTSKFAGLGLNEVGIAYSSYASSLYCIMTDGITIYFGRLSTTGTVLQAATTLAVRTGADTFLSPRVAVNATGDALVMFTHRDVAGLVTNVKAMIVDRNGVVTRAATTVYSSTEPQEHRIIGNFYDSELDEFHVFLASSPYTPNFMRYGRINTVSPAPLLNVFGLTVPFATVYASTSGAQYYSGAYHPTNLEFYLIGFRSAANGPNQDNYVSILKLARDAAARQPG